MSPSPAEAHQSCEAIAHAYGVHADNWDADALADLFTEDGVFDRLGTQIAGRQTISEFIRNRPKDWWQRHQTSNFTFELGEDGKTAKGTLDLVLERGKVGENEVSQTLHCRYHDQFVLTDQGWKFKIRTVVMKEPDA